ncbi:C40 family peptidase [Streptomyces violens]|uniref:C40 family peptidase n=1 Tax=Streptomyces violens TaxID=66377 RepID=UPI0004C14F84|nr:C40 family peptidase [Streptomyces violens]
MTARVDLPVRGVAAPGLLARAGVVSALGLALLVPGSAGDASAAPASGATSAVSAATSGSSGKAALRVAASKKGAPYAWGAEGPHRFDCSGLTQYAFKRVGKRLPRTADSQYRHVRHIKASSRKRGDLVFFHSGRYVYHVGIYAGKGRMWHAPKPGASVRKERIWTGRVWYGRA